MEEILAIPLQCFFIPEGGVTKETLWNPSQGLFQEFRKSENRGNYLPGIPLLWSGLEASFSQLATFQLSLGSLLAFPQPDCIGASGREVALLLNVRGRGALRPAWPTDISGQSGSFGQKAPDFCQIRPYCL